MRMFQTRPKDGDRGELEVHWTPAFETACVKARQLRLAPVPARLITRDVIIAALVDGPATIRELHLRCPALTRSQINAALYSLSQQQRVQATHRERGHSRGRPKIEWTLHRGR